MCGAVPGPRVLRLTAPVQDRISQPDPETRYSPAGHPPVSAAGDNRVIRSVRLVDLTGQIPEQQESVTLPSSEVQIQPIIRVIRPDPQRGLPVWGEVAILIVKPSIFAGVSGFRFGPFGVSAPFGLFLCWPLTSLGLNSRSSDSVVKERYVLFTL